MEKTACRTAIITFASDGNVRIGHGARWLLGLFVLVCFAAIFALGAESPDSPIAAGMKGIVLHLDAMALGSMIRDDSGAVARWNEAVQSEKGRRPRYSAADAEGRPAVVFDGKKDYLAFKPIALRDVTAFVVFTPMTPVSILLGDAANRNWVRIEAQRIKIKWDNTAQAVAGAGPRPGTAHIFSLEREGGTVRFFLDGATIGKVKHTAVFTPEHLGHKFTDGGSENFFCGTMHEVLLVSRGLTDADRRAITKRLAGKWHVGLGSSAPAESFITHGPMLGAVSENTAAIWFRTRQPGAVRVNLGTHGKVAASLTLETKAENDNTAVARFNDLKPNTKYTYTIVHGETSVSSGTFTTLGPALRDRVVRMEYGYGFFPAQTALVNDSIFLHMAQRKPDFVVFIGDFPYTSAGARAEIWEKHKVIRSDFGFPILTRGTPTYAVWDDHDFGPNDCDGTNPNAAQALQAFKEYWANPSYGTPGNAGVYSSFVVGDVQVFLLDGRYHARQDPKNPTMLGSVQFRWLCDGLQHSRARYKVLASGTPFARVKRDCWGGEFFRKERDRLFHFIAEHRITGVIGISGDVHRCDIHKLPMGNGMFFYDFTAGALARVHRRPPKAPWPDELLYSYGYPERNMFGEIDFHPAGDQKTAVTFRSFSGDKGMMHRFRLTPADLGLAR